MSKKISKIVLFALMLFVALAGGLIASTVFHNYKTMVDGIMGLLVLYFTYLLYLSPKSSTEHSPYLFLKLPLDSDGIRSLVPIFLWTMIIYWAVRQILDMALWILRMN
jgi:hypothetical protein